MSTAKQPGTSLPEKKIFVISPIGKQDDSGFDFSDLVLNEIIKPAALEATGFGTPERADEVQAPGSITARIVHAIVEADVCIADLTGRNPNVMYEVAIAHAADKPVILLQQEGGGPPFDFTAERVIHYGTRADLANSARRQLVEFLRNAHQDEQNELLARTMHPVRLIFKDLQTRATATEPEQEILWRLDAIAKSVEKMEAERSQVTKAHRSVNEQPGFGSVGGPKVNWQLIDDVRDIAGKSAADTLASHVKAGLANDEQIMNIALLVAAASKDRGTSRKDGAIIASELASYIDSMPPF